MKRDVRLYVTQKELDMLVMAMHLVEIQSVERKEVDNLKAYLALVLQRTSPKRYKQLLRDGFIAT